MPAMKKTLLQIVQDILSAADSEPIDSIVDTLEGEQATQVVEEVFYDIVLQQVPEHQSLIVLTPASDSQFPTHFKFPDNVTNVEHVWYDQTKALVGLGNYHKVHWCEPMEFLRRSDQFDENSTDVQTVEDKSAGTTLRIRTNQFPQFYTSFDDEWLVMDGFNSAYDDTLQQSKVRAFGRTFPVFDRFDDNYVPDLDFEFHNYLLQESMARFMDRFKGGATPKVEQAARRARALLQNNKYRKTRKPKRVAYGRHSPRVHT